MYPEAAWSPLLAARPVTQLSVAELNKLINHLMSEFRTALFTPIPAGPWGVPNDIVARLADLDVVAGTRRVAGTLAPAPMFVVIGNQSSGKSTLLERVRASRIKELEVC